MASHNAQLDRMEALLNDIHRRLGALEQNSTGTGAVGGSKPVVPQKDRFVPPPVTENQSTKRHPELPGDRNPKQDCRICSGVGLVKCRSCLGKGGQIRCDDCNGSGRDKKIGTYQRCSWCNGTGRKDCLCIGGVAGKEFCDCTMTEEERAKMKELEQAATGMLMGGLNLGIGGMTMGQNVMNSMGDMFKM